MVGLSLPYCLASPLLGYFADKYPVSVAAYLDPSFVLLLPAEHCVCRVLQVTRSWFMVIGGTATGIGFWFLGPAPFFNISR